MMCYYRNLAQLIQKEQEIIFLAPLSLRAPDFRNQNRNAREREIPGRVETTSEDVTEAEVDGGAFLFEVARGMVRR